MNEETGTDPAGAKLLVAVATMVVLLPALGVCLLLFGFSAMCTDDFDDSDCGSAMATPLVLAVVVLALSVAQLVVAGRARTRRSVLLRGLPSLIVAPVGLTALLALWLSNW